MTTTPNPAVEAVAREVLATVGEQRGYTSYARYIREGYSSFDISIGTAIAAMLAFADQRIAAMQLVADQWRAIDTAPKAFGPETDPDDQAIQLWASNIWGMTRWTFGYWIEQGANGSGWWDCAERAFCTPTHWMPLPAAPTPSENSRG